MSSFHFIMAVRLFPALLLPLSTALQIPPAPTRTIGSCRTVGVDFGLARVGVAISSGFAPLPLTVLPCGGETPEDFAAVASSVARVCAGEGAVQVILGMPYNSTGGEGEQAAEYGEVRKRLIKKVDCTAARDARARHRLE